MVNSGQRPDAGSESLREFAYTIQEKAGLSPDTRSRPEAGGETSAPSPGRQALQTSIREHPKTLMAGLAVAAGVLIGYLFGRNKR